MRWLVALIVLALIVPTTSTTLAKIVILEPVLARACPRVKSWNELTGCLAKRGYGARLERAIGKAKLVRVDLGDKGRRVDQALLLYVEDGDGGLKLGGLYDFSGDGATYDVLAAQELTVSGYTGFRIDIGEMHLDAFAGDNVPTTGSIQLSQRSLFCSGRNYRCVDVITWCDVLVDGKAYWTFRGKLTVSDGKIHIAGDRSAASGCAEQALQFLGWPEKP